MNITHRLLHDMASAMELGFITSGGPEDAYIEIHKPEAKRLLSRYERWRKKTKETAIARAKK